ncbi:MAG: hypothetical protein RQ751_07470 [Longimicrobiales bacterium]|nr:hypothetical protein [Longimicrobiales bacterium]
MTWVRMGVRTGFLTLAVALRGAAREEKVALLGLALVLVALTWP